MEYVFGTFRLKPAERELWADGEMVPVPRLAFDCILYLIEHRDRAVGRDELVAAVWGRADVSDGHLNQVIVRARRALGDRGDAQQIIRTVSGFGYRWIEEIEVQSAPARPSSNAVDQSAVETPNGDAGAIVEADRSGPAPSRRVPARNAVATGALLLLLLGLAVLLRSPPSSPPEHVPAASAGNAVVVLPMTIQGPSESAWLGLGAMDLIANHLRAAGLPVPPSETIVTALHGSAARLDRSEVEQVRSVLGAALVVEGKATQSPRGWTVVLTATDAAGTTQQTEARHEDAIRAARLAADLLLAGMGHEPPVSEDGVDSIQERLQQAEAATLTGRFDLARNILSGIGQDEGMEMEVRFRLADVDFRAGRMERAARELDALMADPNVQNDPLRRGRALTLRGNLHYRRSAFVEAAADFDAAIVALQPLSVPLDLCDALTRRGVVAAGLGDFDTASSVFSRARLLAEQGGDRLRIAHVDAGFGLLRLQQNRLELALPYLESAIRQYEAFGIGERVATLLNALNSVYSDLLRWSDATLISDRQWALREQLHEPGLTVIVATRRGRQLVATGRFQDAEDLLAYLHANHADQRPGILRYVHDMEADIAWHRQQWQRTVDAADRALEHWPRSPVYDRYAYLVLLRQRALIASGTASAAQVDAWLPDPDAEKLSVTFHVALAERAAWQERHEEAEAWFVRALQMAETDGTPARIALSARAYADWLLARGQAEKAIELAGRVAVWAREDFDCALLRVKVFQALGHTDTWLLALEQAKALAGERSIPESLLLARY